MTFEENGRVTINSYNKNSLSMIFRDIGIFGAVRSLFRKKQTKNVNCNNTTRCRNQKVVTPSNCRVINCPNKFEKNQMSNFFGFPIKQSIQSKEKLGWLYWENRKKKVTLRNFGNLAIIPEYALNTLRK